MFKKFIRVIAPTNHKVGRSTNDHDVFHHLYCQILSIGY